MLNIGINIFSIAENVGDEWKSVPESTNANISKTIKSFEKIYRE